MLRIKLFKVAVNGFLALVNAEDHLGFWPGGAVQPAATPPVQRQRVQHLVPVMQLERMLPDRAVCGLGKAVKAIHKRVHSLVGKPLQIGGVHPQKLRKLEQPPAIVAGQPGRRVTLAVGPDHIGQIDPAIRRIAVAPCCQRARLFGQMIRQFA